MQKRPVPRRTALAIGASAAALPLCHIRTAGAAGKLNVAITTSFVPGADEVRRAAIEQWAMRTKTEVQVDFLSQAGNQTLLTLASEAQARTGHDIVHTGYYLPTTYAHLLEPADDVVNRLMQAYGPVHASVTAAGKADGHWAAVPTYAGSGIYAHIARIDIFQQQVGIDLREVFPAKSEMGPGYDQWTWDAFLQAAEKCAKAGAQFGLPISPCDDALGWLGVLFRSYGAGLVDAEGSVAVNSDATRTVLEYLKRLAPYLPPDVYSWDNASNNRALVSGRSALIVNPPSAWAQAVKDQPQVGSQCWHFPSPAGPKGRFTYYFPWFQGVWSFSPNKSAAFELIEWLNQRERAEQVCTAEHGYDIPPFLSMSDFKVWEAEGPPAGTLSNYPIKPSHHLTATLASSPAPVALEVQLFNLAVMPNMVAKVTQGGQSIDRAIAWAQGELEGLRR